MSTVDRPGRGGARPDPCAGAPARPRSDTWLVTLLSIVLALAIGAVLIA